MKVNLHYPPSAVSKKRQHRSVLPFSVASAEPTESTCESYLVSTVRDKACEGCNVFLSGALGITHLAPVRCYKLTAFQESQQGVELPTSPTLAC